LPKRIWKTLRDARRGDFVGGMIIGCLVVCCIYDRSARMFVCEMSIFIIGYIILSLIETRTRTRQNLESKKTLLIEEMYNCHVGNQPEHWYICPYLELTRSFKNSIYSVINKKSYWHCKCNYDGHELDKTLIYDNIYGSLFEKCQLPKITENPGD
jgi:hypothetical protein